MIQKSPYLKRLFLHNISDKTNWFSFAAGFILVLAYAPFSQWWITLVAPVTWLYIIRNASVKQATKHGFIFGLGWFGSGISWVHVSIDQFGGLPLVFSLLLMLLLCSYLALFPALACYLSARFSNKKQLNLWLLPLFWALSEYFRSNFLTGFPWLSLGYSQIDSPLAAYAPVIGEIGITSLVLVINICILHIVLNKLRMLHSALLVTIFISAWGLENIPWVKPSGKVIKTVLIQGNIAQEVKWLPEEEWPTMLKYFDLSRENYQADLIIWPESAIPAFEPSVQDYLTTVDSSAGMNNTAIITGILNYHYLSKRYFNGLIVLGKKSADDKIGSYFYKTNNRYYKNHLLPIGEFVPFSSLLRPLAPFFNLPMSSFNRGDYIQENLVANGLHILPLICFEIAFPEQLSANLANDTNILLTVSNDAWFGDSHGPHQHLEIARMRALEFGRPLLRSTNSGITAVVNHRGDIEKIIPQFKEAILKANVTLVEGKTPYSRWGYILQWLIALTILLMVLFNRVLGIQSKRITLV